MGLTTLDAWTIGQTINLERALKVGDALGGHLVSGHVDGLAVLVNRAEENRSIRLTFEVLDQFAPLIAPKGSVALNGVSHGQCRDRPRFGVNIVPHTAEATNLGALKVGDKANFEADTLARYVARYVARQMEMSSSKT